MDTQNTQTENNQKIVLEEGTYEIIRNRLDKYGRELQDKLTRLNEERRRVFGSSDAALIATERIITDNACIPADMVPIGDKFIFGYNVSVRLASITINDVFSVYAYQDHTFKILSPDLISEKTFIDDFSEMYKYFTETRFVKFSRIDKFLYMIFRIGRSFSDIKVFKWIVAGDTLQYVDNRSTHEFRFPEQHEFNWKKATRDMFVEGKHPHVNIENILFVETTEGDLTIKAENNTDTGLGVYSEEVLDPNQTLDDAEFYYSVLGNIIILKIRPYKENEFRYIVYSSKTKSAVRIDAIRNSCVFLPENQGIIFSNGYYLQTGDYKFFENQMENLVFEKRIISPNGEDFIFTFYDQISALYVLLKYNIIEQEIDTPVVCNGFSIFPNGEMVNFRSDGEAKKHHVVQVWKTTFFHADYNTVVDSGSYLFKIGNKDLVKGIADCRELLALLRKDDSYTNLYLELVKKATSILDGHYWISNPQTFELSTSVFAIKEAAASAIDEYEKVVKLKRNTESETEKHIRRAEDLFESIHRKKIENIDEYVWFLSEIRKQRGELISLKKLRYVDTAMVEAYEEKSAGFSDLLSEKCMEHLAGEESMKPYHQRVDEIRLLVDKIKKVIDAEAVSESVVKVSGELEMLIEIVSNLKIKDTVLTSQIIENISSIYSRFNKIKSDIKKKREELFLVEGRMEFASQLKLISQAVVNYLDLCDTPDKTDEYLTKLLVQLEELEGKFTEFNEFVEEIGRKREEIQDAFEQRKIFLLEKRSKRADTLVQSSDRILKAISSRISKLKSEAEINGYFASDIMVGKIREIISELIGLDDTVKADEIQSRLKTVREDTIRQLMDKTELFVEGENIIKLGNQHFTVNTQPLGLTMVNRETGMFFHLSGTGFYEKVNCTDFYKYDKYWPQSIVSENDEVYRGEYLAFKVFADYFNKGEAEPGKQKITTREKTLEIVRSYMSTRYAEGYVKGIHDMDASAILESVLRIHSGAGLLRYSSGARACAKYWFRIYIDNEKEEEIFNQLKGMASILEIFPEMQGGHDLIASMSIQIKEFCNSTGLFDPELSNESAEYLFYELTSGDSFVMDQNAFDLYNEFNEYLKANNQYSKFEKSLSKLLETPSLRYKLIKNWLTAYIVSRGKNDYSEYIDEVAIAIFNGNIEERSLKKVSLKSVIENMEGQHSLIVDRKYQFHYVKFLRKLQSFDSVEVPAFNNYQALKKKLTGDFETELRLDEFRPRVMNSFVRNKLIDKVYLPLIGNNLSKQIGTAGEGKRTDLMGMLLLISPPGYGKTTLMEYIANRLGIIFMKINGPALGHSVLSVDPQEAPNATAREELLKLNLAFEIGDNVMIYIDDIQHCNPEFLQKFISMADAQRKIEGVYKGKSKTYDFRGKKVCLVMAGNPYTESGEKFRIPDMLANRADIYNLGDILGDTEDEFLLSYIENSLTSNPVLSTLAGKSRKDVYTLIESFESGKKEPNEFEANHSAEELREYTSAIDKLLKIRQIIYKVNKEYIYSAGQSDAYRTAPSFKLQGSYRDMNKLAEKVVPVMNDKELDTLILSHYVNESQTLTSDAEANLLKFKSIAGWISKPEGKRWEEICSTYLKNKQSDSGSQLAQVVNQMGAIAEGLGGIRDVLKEEKH
jgi:MoxR-like ATPase